jgi:hypothetical protein
MEEEVKAAVDKTSSDKAPGPGWLFWGFDQNLLEYNQGGHHGGHQPIPKPPN